MKILVRYQRAWRDSNPRPSEPESDALSTELHALALCEYNISLTTDEVNLIANIAIGN